VYTTHPSICPRRRKLDAISYDEMLELGKPRGPKCSKSGRWSCQEVHVPIHVRSTFTQERGTMVVAETKDMEKVLVSGVAYNRMKRELQ